MSAINFYIDCLEEQQKVLKELIGKAKALQATIPVNDPTGNDQLLALIKPAHSHHSGEKKPKKIKDPNAPKKNQSAYQLYFMEALAPYRAANPDKDPRVVMSDLGKSWSLLNEQERKKYIEAAAVLKEKYERDIANYRKGLASNSAAPVAAESDSDSSDDDVDIVTTSHNFIHAAVPVAKAAAVPTVKTVFPATATSASVIIKTADNNVAAAVDASKKTKLAAAVSAPAPVPAAVAIGASIVEADEDKKKHKKQKKNKHE